jgi:hypothetical protein
VAARCLSFFIGFLLLSGHGIGGDETDTVRSHSEDQSQPSRSVGLPKGKVSFFCVDRLFFDDEWIIAIALLCLLTRNFMSA